MKSHLNNITINPRETIEPTLVFSPNSKSISCSLTTTNNNNNNVYLIKRPY